MKYLVVVILLLTSSIVFSQVDEIVMVGKVKEAKEYSETTSNAIREAVVDIKKCYAGNVSITDLRSYTNGIQEHVAAARLAMTKAEEATAYVESRSNQVNCIKAERNANAAKLDFKNANEKMRSCVDALAVAGKAEEKEVVFEYVSLVLDDILAAITNLNLGMEKLNDTLQAIDDCY